MRAPWVWIAVASIVLGAAALLWWNSSSRSRSRLASPVEVPNPNTTGFEEPVQEVIARTRQAVLDQPTSMMAWGSFATVLDAHMFFSAAEIAYRRALELAPDDPGLSYNLAILLETLGGDPNESLSLYRRFAQQQPKFPPVHFRIGRVLAMQGDMESAAKSYRAALALDPELMIARRGLGQALVALDDTAAAASELERVAREAPEDGPTQAALAQIYTRMGDEARATEAMRRWRESSDRLSLEDPVHFLVKQAGRSARQASNRAAGRVQSADYAGVVEDLKIVLRTRGNDPRIHARLADAYEHLGESALAEQHLAEARKLRGEN
jgi:tetratricopeptide (TPR) repeat protein